MNNRVFLDTILCSAAMCLVAIALPINHLMACTCGCGCAESSSMVFEDIPERYLSGSYHYTASDLDQLYIDMKEYSISDIDKAFDLCNIAKSLDENFPVMKEMEDGSIIYTNITAEEIASQDFQKQFIWTMKSLGICESEEDIDFLDNEIHVITQICKKKGFWSSDSESEWCKDNCDSIAAGLMFSCSMLRNRTCSMIATAAVESLRRSCKYCCSGGGFLQRCLWPLKDYCVRCDLEEVDW